MIRILENARAQLSTPTRNIQRVLATILAQLVDTYGSPLHTTVTFLVRDRMDQAIQCQNTACMASLGGCTHTHTAPPQTGAKYCQNGLHCCHTPHNKTLHHSIFSLPLAANCPKILFDFQLLQPLLDFQLLKAVVEFSTVNSRCSIFNC